VRVLVVVLVLAIMPCKVASASDDTGVAPPPDPSIGERTDGRVDPPAKRHWRIVPRVLLFPFYGLIKLIEYPVAAALKYEDRKHPFGRFTSLFTWSGGDRGLRPAFYYSTIYVPEVGLHYFDRLSLGTDTRLDLTATTGGSRYVYSALHVEPTPVTSRIGVALDVVFDRRADLLYNGLGNHTYSDAPTGRYLMNGLDGRLTVVARPIPWLSMFASFDTGLERFGNGDPKGGDQPIFATFNTHLIPGFSEGVTFVRPGVGAIVALRDSLGRPSRGVIARVQFDYTVGIDGTHTSFPRLYGALGVPINLLWHTHVLWLYGATALAWQRGSVPVPFSELPTLGGPNDLRGFRFQDFRDYTSLFFTAEYRWPIYMWADAALFVDYGGVFGQNFIGFAGFRMQPDVGGSIRMFTSQHFYLRVQLAYGFGEGFNFSLAGSTP
jgi:hypothetical protein